MTADMIYVCVLAKSDTSRQITTFSLAKLLRQSWWLWKTFLRQDFSQILCQHVVDICIINFKVSFEDGLGISNFEKYLMPTHSFVSVEWAFYEKLTKTFIHYFGKMMMMKKL